MPAPWPSPTKLTLWPRSGWRPGSPQGRRGWAVVSTGGFRDPGPSRLTWAHPRGSHSLPGRCGQLEGGNGGQADCRGRSKSPSPPEAGLSLPRPQPGPHGRQGLRSQETQWSPRLWPAPCPRGSFPPSLCSHVAWTEKTGTEMVTDVCTMDAMAEKNETLNEDIWGTLHSKESDRASASFQSIDPILLSKTALIRTVSLC